MRFALVIGPTVGASAQPGQSSATLTPTLVHRGDSWVGVPHAVGGLEESLEVRGSGASTSKLDL